MARRYDHSREELLQMAIQAARSLVIEEGTKALTVRKVATEMGYAVGTIYNLFKNVDDLIIHLNATTLDALHNNLTTIVFSGNVESDIKKLANSYIDFTFQNLNLWNALFEHSLPKGEILPDWYNKKIELLLNIVEAALAPLKTSISEEEIKKAARVLWSSLHGICSLATADKLKIMTKDPAIELSNSLVTNYIAGLQQFK
ncbi:TetR/AcrR family transcriptional regulator [Curvivirga sp.]|uniref:TetR/AcrR family transcriptional regulator n=1 Tax=Curvivirga sp. TaxID=2856848 RepID=UPI003B58B889